MPTRSVSYKKPKWAITILKAFIYVIWFVVFTEAASRLLFTLFSPNLFFRHPAMDDSSLRLFWIKNHRDHQGQLFAWTSGQYAVYHPTRGWTPGPDLRDVKTIDGTILATNSKGLRGKREYEYQREPKTHRILVLGDSFTFGNEVTDDETYSHVLEAALPNTEVLDLGVSAYGHDQMLLYLEEEGVKYHPDIVILGFVFLDIRRNLLTFLAYEKPKFNLTSSGLELINVPVPTPDRVLAQEAYRSKALDLGVLLWNRVEWRLGINETKAKNLTRLILDRIIATTRSAGAVPVIVYMPVAGEIVDSREALTEEEEYLFDYCQSRRALCLFLRPRFREEINKGVKLNTVGHWGPNVHQVAAQSIKDFLRDRGLIEDNSQGGTHR